MRSIAFVSLIALAPSLVHAGEIRSYTWPQVARIIKTFRFSGSKTQVESLTVTGVSGTPLYWLGCHSEYYQGEPVDPKHDDQNDYFGDLDCHLHALYEPDDTNLLVTDPYGFRENFSRLLTTASDLQGVCAEYPEWGALRHVTLRGMALTFTYKGAEIHRETKGAGPGWDGNVTLGGVQLEIKVEPDPQALSTIALDPPFERPRYPLSLGQTGGSLPCARVVPHHIPGEDLENYVRRNRLGPPYPQVASAENASTFEVDKEKHWQVPVLDREGGEAYLLRCQASIGEAGLDRWGVLCELVQPGTDLDLLAESVDPYSRRLRGLIDPEHIEGRCADYPEWGTVRNFKLRGLEVTLRVSHLLKDKHGGRRASLYGGPVAGFELRASVRPEPTATAAVAPPSNYVDWSFLHRPNPCDQVVIAGSHLP